MSGYEVGTLVSSKAGHDKCNIYVIIKAEAEYVYLVDGTSRTLEKPKKKNLRHIQIVNYTDPELLAHRDAGTLRDEHIKRTIKLYESRIENFRR